MVLLSSTKFYRIMFQRHMYSYMICEVICRMNIQEYNYKRDLDSMNIDYRHEYVFLFGGVCKGHETRATTVQ